MFSQRSGVELMQKVYFCFVREASGARKFFAGRAWVFLLNEPPQAAKRISALPSPRAARALPRG
jgi:hypothetical protein